MGLSRELGECCHLLLRRHVGAVGMVPWSGFLEFLSLRIMFKLLDG